MKRCAVVVCQWWVFQSELDGLVANSQTHIHPSLQSVKETSKLYCYYKMDRPYLRLAPFKVEILRFNPLGVLFHSVMSDAEVEQIQGLAKPKLARATVQNSVTGQLETASYRISKSAWLKGEEHEVVDRINRRMELMTNLDMETAEELQIANYGIGGHYDPHYDFARVSIISAMRPFHKCSNFTCRRRRQRRSATLALEIELPQCSST